MTIDEQIAVMTAFKNGVKIQTKCKTIGFWIDNETPSWNFTECEYRVKPSYEINGFLTKLEKYWFVYGDYISSAEYGCVYDKSDYINVFETEEEARKYYKLEKAKLRVKCAIATANNGEVIDFTRTDTSKYFICIDRYSSLAIDCTYTYKTLPYWLYIASESDAMNIIREHRDDLLLILGE